MKTLTSSVAFQDEAGNALSNGSLIFSLPTGVYLISSGGGQVIGQSFIINLDVTGKVPASITIWASDEINPQTPYSVVLCAQANGAQPVGTATWFIGGVSPIDLSLMTQTSTGISYSGAVLLNPTAQQNINGQTLNMEGASVGFSATGSTIADSFVSRIAAGVVAVGTAIGNALGTLRAAILQIGGSDTGLTRDSAAVIDVGNGAPGSKSGRINLTTLGLNKSDGTVPATISNDTTGGVNVATNGGKTWNFANGGALSSPAGLGVQLSGATSGSVSLAVPAVAGSNTWTIPAATDTASGKATIDVFTNKTYDTAGTGNVFKINGTSISAVTGSGSAVLATSPALTTPTIGGETISQAPRMCWTPFLSTVPSGTTGYGHAMVVEQGITITHVVIGNQLASAGCSTMNATVNDGISDIVTVAMANGSFQTISGALSVNVPSGKTLNIKTIATGCTTLPSNVSINVQYKMQ